MIRGHFDRIAGRDVCGWAWDPTAPLVPVTVQVLLNGQVVAAGIADHHRPDLEAACIGNGHHAFFIPLPDALTDGRTGNLVVCGQDGVPLAGTPVEVTLPDTIFRPVPPPASPPPLTLAVCAILKNEGPYLLEWIAHHRLVGVEHFVLFDNGSTDETGPLLSGLARAGIVDYIPWPDIPHNVAAQRPAYMAGLARLAERCRWVAFIDGDEFLNPLRGEDLKSILADHDMAAGLVVPWRLYGSNGRMEREDDLVTRRFTRRAAADHPLNRSVKTIVQARLVAAPDIHTPRLTAGSLVDEGGRLAGSQGHPDRHAVPDAARLVINHYFTKSRAEWIGKRNRGCATEPVGSVSRVRPDDHFTVHDLNDVEDRLLADRAGHVRAEMERLRTLLR
ncbi:glycosyltransferase family 92 protein [Niveispirillum sp. KHB5.9]|uniref:glycosyltransferase family 92 protein n=1 Tax=Niveispirillum sp. KHB5.9 TaxID=3400269 RepID=UPI003A870A10